MVKIVTLPQFLRHPLKDASIGCSESQTDDLGLMFKPFREQKKENSGENLLSSLTQVHCGYLLISFDQ